MRKILNVRNFLILVICSTLLQGCFLFKRSKDIEINTVYVPKEKIDIKDPKPVSPKEIEWYILTPENVEEVFNELKTKKYDIVIFGLTDDGYKNLSLNLAELRKYIIEQRAIIKAYRDYYESEK